MIFIFVLHLNILYLIAYTFCIFFCKLYYSSVMSVFLWLEASVTKSNLCMSQWKSFRFWLQYYITRKQSLVPKVQDSFSSSVFCIDNLSLISHPGADNATHISVEICASIMSDQWSSACFRSVLILLAVYRQQSINVWRHHAQNAGSRNTRFHFLHNVVIFCVSNVSTTDHHVIVFR